MAVLGKLQPVARELKCMSIFTFLSVFEWKEQS